jgi:3-oxoacyl-[acyl-carrier protein] reductase
MPVALIAVASGGLGRAIAPRLAADGYDTALTFLDREEVARAVAEEVTGRGRRAALYPCDLQDEAAVRAMVAATVSDFGAIDLLVYAAGPFIPLKWISELEPAQFRSVVLQDTVAFFNLARIALEHLRASSGAVVALSTPAVRRHSKRDLMSAAPKASVEAIARGLAAEEGRFGIRANCVGCGIIAAGLFDQLVGSGDFDEVYFEAVRKNVPLGRLGSAADVAEAVAFLASPEQAGYISGQTLVVDGGYEI